jgi:OOP family OmpA-OmpF porin
MGRSERGTGNFMKKVLYAVALASAIALTAPIAQADSQGAFISLSAGQSRFSSSELLTPRPSRLPVGVTTTTDDLRDRALGLLMGYRWTATASLHLGVEAGYSDLGEATSRSDTVVHIVGQTITANRDSSEKARAALLGVNAKWDLPGNWTATAHAGMARYRTDFDISDVETISGAPDVKSHHDSSDSNNDYYYGVGVGYDFTPHLGLMLAFDEFRPEFRQDLLQLNNTNINHLKVWGLRAEYRF